MEHARAHFSGPSFRGGGGGGGGAGEGSKAVKAWELQWHTIDCAMLNYYLCLLPTLVSIYSREFWWTLCPQGNFSCFFVVCWFFQNQFFRKILSGIPSECQTDWIQIRPNILSGLIWVQSVCKSYQQTTIGYKELNLKVLIWMEYIQYAWT